MQVITQEVVRLIDFIFDRVLNELSRIHYSRWYFNWPYEIEVSIAEMIDECLNRFLIIRQRIVDYRKMNRSCCGNWSLLWYHVKVEDVIALAMHQSRVKHRAWARIPNVIVTSHE